MNNFLILCFDIRYTVRLGGQVKKWPRRKHFLHFLLIISPCLGNCYVMTHCVNISVSFDYFHAINSLSVIIETQFTIKEPFRRSWSDNVFWGSLIPLHRPSFFGLRLCRKKSFYSRFSSLNALVLLWNTKSWQLLKPSALIGFDPLKCFAVLSNTRSALGIALQRGQLSHFYIICLQTSYKFQRYYF